MNNYVMKIGLAEPMLGHTCISGAMLSDFDYKNTKKITVRFGNDDSEVFKIVKQDAFKSIVDKVNVMYLIDTKRNSTDFVGANVFI